MGSYQKSSFRNKVISCKWVFDLSAVGYDHLDVYLQLQPDESTDPTQDIAKADARDRGLAERTRLAQGAIPQEVRDYLALPPSDIECRTSSEFLLRLYFTLVAIDDASEEINGFSSGAPSDDIPMAVPGAWFEEHRRLNTYRTAGRVLFRTRSFPADDNGWAQRSVALGERKHLQYRGQHLYRRFENLCRVPELTGCEIDYEPIPLESDVILPRPFSQLVIGVVPLIESLSVGHSECSLVPGPLKLRVAPMEPKTCSYIITGDGEEISPESADQKCAQLADRAEAAIRYLQAEGAQIAILPELVVPDSIVRRIKRVLAETNRGRHGLQLVVAGSYCRGQGPNQLPYNEAIVLNRCGDELWRQRKLHAYEMHPYEQVKYGVERFFSGICAREAIATHPRTLRVRDSRLGRLAVLICEDVAQPTPGFNNLTALQVNYVFTPVMAGALYEDRSFARQASRLAFEAAAICVVANSGTLARAEPLREDQPPPLGIVSLPLLEVAGKTPVAMLFQDVALPSPPGGSVLLFRCPSSP